MHLACFVSFMGNVGKISAWHKMRDDMHARETGSKTVIKILKGPPI